MTIRPPLASDLPAIARVLEDTELFPAEMLEGMMTPFFQEPDTQDKWLVCQNDDGHVTGFSFVRPEPLTEGVWNLLAIGFREAYKGQGHGATLVAEIEKSLANERLLIVETSSLPMFSATCAFYEKCGYVREAVIRNYWAPDDDKIIFVKLLASQ